MVINSVTWDKGIEIDLVAIPNSKEFKIAGFDEWSNTLRVKVKGKALKGEANKELLGELGKMFGAKAQLVSGEKNRKKKILLEGNKEHLEKFLQTLILQK